MVVEINANYLNCKQEVDEDWQISKHKRNHSLDLSEQQLCCSRWDYIDCLLHTAKVVCTEEEYKLLKAKTHNWNQVFEKNNCTEYVYHSYGCHFPIWLSLLILLFVCLVLSIIAFAVIYYCLKYN
jgi:hypothetical protein